MLTTTASESTLKRKNTNDSQIGSLGEGDSYYEESVFSSETAKDILQRLDEQVVYLPREQFKFRIFNTVNLLPRDKAFYGDVQSDGSCECDKVRFFSLKRDFLCRLRSTLSI